MSGKWRPSCLGLNVLRYQQVSKISVRFNHKCATWSGEINSAIFKRDIAIRFFITHYNKITWTSCPRPPATRLFILELAHANYNNFKLLTRCDGNSPGTGFSKDHHDHYDSKAESLLDRHIWSDVDRVGQTSVHYNDVIMTTIASQITSLPVVLLNRLFRGRSKKTSKLRVTGFCVGNSLGPVNFPQRASNAENVSIWWRHHVLSAKDCCRLLYRRTEPIPIKRCSIIYTKYKEHPFTVVFTYLHLINDDVMT